MYKLRLLVVVSFFSLSLSVEADESSFDLSLEELLNVEVTSVSKQRQPLSNSPAAIYVLTNKDLIRSGATSIPQALRDVPGLHVAQLDSQKWAVSSRGFNGRFNNKLLVLMDGRALYSPGFSGVYWEVQDTLMSDIDRIEVIRGPSAAMWGANAVNGVINIITKHSADTLGGYAELGLGDYEKGFVGFRYGGKLAEGMTARGYVKSFERDTLEHESSGMDGHMHDLMAELDNSNAWRQHQLGGRLDMKVDGSSTLTLSADGYQSSMNQISSIGILTAPYAEFSTDNIKAEGWNVLANYTKALSASSEYNVKVYYDYVSREGDVFNFTTDTFDFDFQYLFQTGRHNVIWGLGYRYIADEIESNVVITMDDMSESTHLWSAFVRDEITLVDDTLWLTLATRVENNTYTDMEWQPNARLMWQLNEQHKIWSSIAYSVRTPSRAEASFNVQGIVLPPEGMIPFPTELVFSGTDEYESETLVAYEIGYRFAPTPNFSMDSTVFYNQYDNLRSIDSNSGIQSLEILPVPHIKATFPFGNDEKGSNLGFELSSQWLASKELKFKLNYAYVHSDFGTNQVQNTNAPNHIGSLSGNLAISEDVDFNMTWRYVDNAELVGKQVGEMVSVDSYYGVDIGVNWRVSPKVNVSLYGKNLFEESHLEYSVELFAPPFYVEPSFYGKIALEF